VDAFIELGSGAIEEFPSGDRVRVLYFGFHKQHTNSRQLGCAIIRRNINTSKSSKPSKRSKSAKTSAPPPMLNSWKEIASYLGRGVRTVQRWERENDLPVHRIGKGRRSPVCAMVPELKFWLQTSTVDRMRVPQASSGGKDRTATPIENSRRLLLEFRRLVRAVAVTSVRQHKQAEILEKGIQALRSRMK
jgi:excisionase family DNA binding protein